MKKVVGLSIIFIIVDQIFRFFAQYNLSNEVIGNNYFGLTYRINYGIWIYSNAPRILIISLQIIFILILFFSYFIYDCYCKYIRKSLLIDISYASFIAAILGNVYIDRILFGYVRDYIKNPIAISNLADILIIFTIILLFLEILLFEDSKVIFRVDFNIKNTKRFLCYIKNKIT